jgi:hypothetical protein
MKNDKAARRRLDPLQALARNHRPTQPGAKPATGQSNPKPEEQRNIIAWSANGEGEPKNQPGSRPQRESPRNSPNVKYFRIFSEIFWITAPDYR